MVEKKENSVNSSMTSHKCAQILPVSLFSSRLLSQAAELEVEHCLFPICIWATRLSSHFSIVREWEGSWRLLQDASLGTALTANTSSQWMCWSERQCSSVQPYPTQKCFPHYQIGSTSHSSAASVPEQVAVRTEQLTSINTKARKCLVKSLCML